MCVDVVITLNVVGYGSSDQHSGFNTSSSARPQIFRAELQTLKPATLLVLFVFTSPIATILYLKTVSYELVETKDRGKRGGTRQQEVL